MAQPPAHPEHVPSAPLGGRTGRIIATLAELMQSRKFQTGETDEVLRTVAQAAAQLLQVDRVGIWMRDDGARSWVCRELFEIGRGPGGHGRHSSGITLSQESCAAYLAALAKGDTVVAHEAATAPVFSEWADGYLVPVGVVSRLDCPIHQNGTLHGALCVEHLGAPRAWEPEDELAAGMLAGVLSMHLESQRRRQAEARHAETEANLEALLQSSDDLIWSADREGRMVACNGAFAKHMQALTGRAPKPGQKVTAELPLDRAAVFEEWIARTISGETVRTTFRSGLKDRVLWLDHTITPIRRGGEVVGAACIARDITARVMAEEELRLTADRLRLAVKAANIGIWDWDIAGNGLVWDETVCGVYGLAPGVQPVIGETWWNAQHPDDRERVRADLEAALRGEREFDNEQRIMRPDGTVRHIRVAASVMRDPAGQPARMVGVLYDITERKRSENDLRESRQMLATVLDHFPGSVFWKDAESVYLGCNRAFAASAGIDLPAAIVGKNDLDLPWDPADAERYRADDWRVIASGRPKLGVVEAEKRADGRTVWFESNRVPLRDAQGEIIGVLGTSVDVSPRMRAEEELRHLNATLETRIAERTAQLDAARKEAEAANKAKSAFLANISHEVRTPMNGILGLAELLRQTPLTAEQREWTDTLRDSGEALLRLLNDVLDLSKVEAGRMVLEEAPFALRRELSAVVNLMAARAKQKGLELRLRVADGVPDALVGDALRLRQILTNLVGNAVKFTEKGWVEMAVQSEAGAAPGHVRLRLSVADTGVGVPEEQLVRIFTPFTQADSSVTRKYGGSGLGLSICARLAEMMGGHAFAQNREGGGSVFHVVCEFASEEGGDAAAAGPAAHSASKPAAFPAASEAPPVVHVPRSRRILLVEDNPVNQKVATALLSRRGHSVEVANHGEEALAASALKEFDVILMDVQMPVMDGLEATRRLRAREAAGGLPRRRIVAMTASAMAGDRDICLAAGMDDYIAKPFQPEELYAKVEDDTPPLPPAFAPETDIQAALGMMAGERGILEESVRAYLRDRGRLLTDLKGAIHGGDPAGVRIAAHGFKGALAIFQARTAVTHAQAIEQAGRAGGLEGVPEIMLQFMETEARVARELEDWLGQPGGVSSPS